MKFQVRFAFWCILIALTFTIISAGGELVCRLAGVGEPNRTLTGSKKLFVPDPDPLIGFRMRPNYEDFVYGAPVSINPNGLRDDNDSYQKPKNAKQILVLGDSVTFGYGVTEEDTFSELLEQMNQNIQVINSGVPSYTTVQEVRWFEVEGLKYNPDAVILMYVMNDPEPVHQLDENGLFIPQEIDEYYAEVAALFPKPVLPFIEYSQLTNFLNRLILHTHPNWMKIHNRLTQYFNRDIFQTPHWNACQAAVKRLKELCEENHIKLLAVIYPLMYRLHSTEDHSFTRHYEIVQHMFAEQGVPCLLPLDQYIGQNVDDMRAYVDDPHPSRKSHRIMAKAIYHAFRGQTGVIPRWNEFTDNSEW